MQFNKPITKKQIDFIKAICKGLCISFKGTTRAEASAFIRAYSEEFYREQEISMIMHEEYSFI